MARLDPTTIEQIEQLRIALGLIPEGAIGFTLPGVLDILPRICELVRAGMDAETVAAWKDAD